MKISYFREFLVLTKYLNFSLAADHLRMTQPGLSRHISTLEKEIGVRFFKRNTHSVKLTEKGELFLKGIEKIVEDYDFLCRAVQTDRLEKITIGVPYFGVNRYLSHIMSSFEEAFPEVKVDYFPSYPDAIIAGLFAKQVDVAVFPKANFRGAADLVFHEVFKERIVVLLNKGNPIAAKKGVHIADLENENFINVQGNYGDALFEQCQELCRKRNLSPPQKAAGTKTIEEAALKMRPESGVMLLPEHLRETNISKDVAFVDILDEECSLTICLVTYPLHKNPATKEFINFYLKKHRATNS